MGIMRMMPYMRFAGRMAVQPPFLTLIQTDGSYGRQGARVAACIRHSDSYHIFKYLESIQALNSTETEWASVEMGLRNAIDTGATAVGIENDNLGVVYGLMYPVNPLKHTYARHWRSQILELGSGLDWAGIRWIDRNLNEADALFR
jgi:hypothetical protein